MSSVSASDIALELASRLATITVANGFNTDIGLRVYRGRRDIAVESLPCTVLAELEDVVEDRSGRKGHLVKLSQVYAIEGHDLCDADHPNDKAHLVIKDLKRAVFGAPFTLQVAAVDYRGRTIGVRNPGLNAVPAAIRISVQFSEDLATP